MTTYTHLHIHSDRSALDSVLKIPDLIRKTRELGMSSVALTDHGVCSGAIMFWKECKKEVDKEGNSLAPVNPIIGMEAYLSPTDDHTLKEVLEGHPKQQCYHLTLLAKNMDGVSQLYELSSRGYLEGFYYKPRISLPMIEDIGKDLIVMGACAKGPVSWNILQGNDSSARQWLKRLQELFEGRFYLEVMDHGLDWQRPLNAELEALADEFEIPWVPTNDCHFLEREDLFCHKIMMCLQLKQTLEELTMKYPEECYLKSPAEMEELFGREACLRTLEIAEQVNIEMNLGQTIFPVFS